MEPRKSTLVPADKMWDPVALWSTMLDAPRQQSMVATHAASALIGGLDAMCKTQEKIAHDALDQCGAAAHKLERHCGPLDVLAVQMELARVGVEAGTAYWQQMADAALQTQARMAACGCELVDADRLLEGFAMFEER
jgi:hypothetical protein